MDVIPQLRASLAAASLPTPSTSFLASLVASRSPPPPPPSLLATAKARLLACDLTTASAAGDAALLDAAALAALPAAATDPAAASTRLARDVHVQVLDVENIAVARWDQVEELEAVARGETTRGRHVVRLAADDGAAAAEQPSSTQRAAPVPVAAGQRATHRLVLQDCRGTRVYAVELRRVDAIAVGKTGIGEKVLLRAGTVIARGVVLITPDTSLLLGGRVEAWHEAWTEGRLRRLKEAAASHEH